MGKITELTMDEVLKKFSQFSRNDFGLAGDGKPEYISIKDARTAMYQWQQITSAPNNWGKTQDYHYTGEKCVAGCKRFSHYETKHHPDCPFYKDSLSKTYDQLQQRISELEKERDELKEQFGIMDGRRERAIKSLEESEKQFGEQQQEVERLKGLIEQMYWRLFHAHLENDWEQFKTENNL